MDESGETTLQAGVPTLERENLALPHREGRGGIGLLRQRPLTDRLIERLPDVELHVVGPGSARR